MSTHFYLSEMENNLKLATDQWSENGSFQKKSILGILLDKDKEDKDNNKDKVITGSSQSHHRVITEESSESAESCGSCLPKKGLTEQ